MMERSTFAWSGRTQTGVALFALSLIWLAVVAPGEIALSTAIGGGSALALFGITGSRLSLGVLTALMLVVLACAAFAAVMEHGLALIPVAAAQLAAVVLMERSEQRFWIRSEAMPLGARV